MHQSSAAVAVAIALLAAVSATAATKTATMAVTENMASLCSVTAQPLAFGTYTPGNGAVPATMTVNVRCTAGALYGIGLSIGTTTGAAYTQRLLGNGANTLQYNLYSNSNHTTIWGDGTGSTVIVYGNSAGITTAVPWTVYGLIPDNATNQAAVPGTYTDTVTVVLTY